MLRILSAILIVFTFTTHAYAGNRASNKFGIIVGIDTPFPTVFGGNVAFHLGDFARISGGYGSISATSLDAKLEASTLGGAFNVFIPSWNLSPTVGVGYAQVDVKVTGTAAATLDVGGFKASDSHTYLTYGLDWVASSGFHFGLGMNTSLKTGVGSLFYLNLGWFF